MLISVSIAGIFPKKKVKTKEKGLCCKSEPNQTEEGFVLDFFIWQKVLSRVRWGGTGKGMELE